MFLTILPRFSVSPSRARYEKRPFYARTVLTSKYYRNHITGRCTLWNRGGGWGIARTADVQLRDSLSTSTIIGLHVRYDRWRIWSWWLYKCFSAPTSPRSGTDLRPAPRTRCRPFGTCKTHAYKCDQLLVCTACTRRIWTSASDDLYKSTAIILRPLISARPRHRQYARKLTRNWRGDLGAIIKLKKHSRQKRYIRTARGKVGLHTRARACKNYGSVYSRKSDSNILYARILAYVVHHFIIAARGVDFGYNSRGQFVH